MPHYQAVSQREWWGTLTIIETILTKTWPIIRRKFASFIFCYRYDNEHVDSRIFGTDSWYTNLYFYLGNLMSSDYHPNPAINQTNVLGTALASCCFDPITGYYRNGFCHTGNHDVGQHTVCVKMTSEFLNFSASRGNDLITPLPEYNFPGLKPGDYWS